MDKDKPKSEWVTAMQLYVDEKLTLEWWESHRNGGTFSLADVPPEVATCGLWFGWFKIKGEKLIVPKR